MSLLDFWFSCHPKLPYNIYNCAKTYIHPSKACTEAHLPGDSKICLQRIDYFGCVNWHKNVLIWGGFIPR